MDSMVRLSSADLDGYLVMEGNNNMAKPDLPDNLKDDDKDEGYSPLDLKEGKIKKFQGQTLFVPANINRVVEDTKLKSMQVLRDLG